ncbi:MAG: DUF423 domain-containing protein [Chitinophagales bacterium]|nr:DUF423 domain-containing protein [Chitinophagales bacterium]
MKNIFALACVSGALAVALGAFGAHGLKPYLDAYQTEIYNKAVFYQFVHTLIIAVISWQGTTQKIKLPAILFLVGILLFSGSLYLLSTAHLHGMPKIILGPITPIGGLCFIGGWLTLAFGVGKK